jgi:outer membrane receptor protein involved in Fe transport
MKSRYMISCAVAAVLSGCGGAAMAADPAGAAPTSAQAADSSAATSGVEEVVVTAQRRTESVQNVPGTVQALTGVTLSRLNVVTLDELLRYTPNVSYGNNGPGQGNIFIRGLSAGFAGNQSSATAGNFPNVAIYLDDESMQFPARNVDIYVADMERVEVLEGPQGALFGGGAEAGAVRYITNKPKLNVFEGSAEAAYGYTEHGDPNSSGQVVVNLPLLTDRLAVRAVFYDERQGGYIDNVPSTFTRMNSDLGNAYFNIKPTNGLCPNHLPAGPAGLCSPPNSGPINNSAIAANNQNPTTYQGGRVSALFAINNDWDLLVAESFQQLDADGLSADYPIGSDGQVLKPLQVTSFNPSYDKDSYANTAWTLTGKIGDLKAVYTGGYLLRNIRQQMEYTNYSRTSGGMYYQCTGGSTGFGTGPGYCYSPNGYWQDTVRNTHLTQEVRLSTPDDWRIRAIGGAFYEDFRIYDDQNFNYKTIPACDPPNLAAAQAGGPVCLSDVTTVPGVPTNHPGIRSDNTAFGEDAQRGYDQVALFGSVDFDIIPHVLTVTGGTRYFEYSENEFGTQYGTTTGCLNVPNGQCAGGVVNIDNAHDKKVYKGFKSRANITWHITPDLLTYFTFSQGFRPGGFNRSVSAVANLNTTAPKDPQFEKPNSYAPDSLDNYEVGLKSELFEHRLQLDLSAYYMQWHDVQFLFFNPVDLGNTTFGVNGPSYDIYGAEAQFVGRVTEGLTVQGSLSYNVDEQYTSPCLKSNIPSSPTYGTCITSVKGAPFANPFGSIGSTPPFSPRFQGNIRARYEWTIEDYKAFATLGASYTGDMYNQPATYQSGNGVTIPTTTYLRYLQPQYVTVDGSVGVNIKNYTISVYGTNLLDSHASTFTSSAQFIKSEVPLRPRVIMAKIAAKF